MALVKAEGLIIHSLKLGETSKLITLFSRELGELKLVAKGSRSSKSRFGAALEPLTVSRVVYYEKANHELQYLSQADIVEFFPNLSIDLEKWGYANACAELVSRTHTSLEAIAKLYPILLNTLRAMNEMIADASVCFWGFQMKLLGVLGVAPSLRRCVHCNTTGPTVETASRVYQFDIARGGFRCDRCPPIAGAPALSGETLLRLVNFQTLPAEKFSHLKISPTVRREIENFFRAYFSFHLEEIGGLASLKFVHKIAAPPAK
jgi:DNA repair protein RecO (recombination protein O)